MIRISRNNQIIFYIVFLCFSVFFFFYFYRQASVTEGDFLDVKVDNEQSTEASSQEDVNIDIKIFTSEKFRNLRSEVAPIKDFKTGKRNPFESF